MMTHVLANFKFKSNLMKVLFRDNVPLDRYRTVRRLVYSSKSVWNWVIFLIYICV